MNAQEKWKGDYNIFIPWHCKKRIKKLCRQRMYWIRREAALERIIARQAREIEYLRADLELARKQVSESEDRREFAARLEFGS